jgi:hypothetical protein
MQRARFAQNPEVQQQRRRPPAMAAFSLFGLAWGFSPTTKVAQNEGL